MTASLLPETVDDMFPNRTYPDVTLFVRDYLDELRGGLLGVGKTELEQAVRVLSGCAGSNATIFVCGNGGSAAIANHFCCDATKGVSLNTGRRIRAVSLCANVPLMSALANDIAYREVFSKQLELYAKSGDVLVAITSSGNSPNIVCAIEVAKSLGVATIVMTGFNGGDARRGADVSLHVDVENYGVVEDCHQALMHCLCQFLVLSAIDANSISNLRL